MNDSEQADELPLQIRDLAGAERLAGLSFTQEERELLLYRARAQLTGYRWARVSRLPNGLEPALHFDPRPPATAREALPPPVPPTVTPDRGTAAPPPGAEQLPFLPVGRLASLLRSGEVSSLELTRLSLERLRRFGPRLRCLVTLTEELALEQAVRADRELAAGIDRGALHGLPYGAKDLLAVPGYPTTWGAEQYRGQSLEDTATVVERLEAAGAVLVAKLSLGELAMGDVWFGGKTLNPWDPTRGSSGSSAGSAAAVAAGLVPFAVGSETMGSIVNPAVRCSVVGLRPSAGRVSRHGAMALAWSLDKLGPFARSVEDCALVLQAIAGPDGRDPTVVDLPFRWESASTAEGLRIGYVEEAFSTDGPQRESGDRLLEGLRERGFDVMPIELPEFAPEPIMTCLMVEAAAAFDEMTRSGEDERLAQQGQGSWPNLLRAARLVPAVEYLQASRLRTLAVRRMRELFTRVDAYLCPSGHRPNLYLTNATGNPCVVVPEFDASGGIRPEAMTITGSLYGESEALTVARLVEQLSGPRPRPDLDRLADSPQAAS